MRDIRLRRGLSQADLSRLTGVAEFTISEIEADKRTPRPSTLRKLAKGLDVDVADFYAEPAYPLGEAPTQPQPSLNDALEEGRRLRPWISYLGRRVEWREKIFDRKPDEEFNNPWLSLETAIQWALDIGAESADLRNIINRDLLTEADSLTSEADELRALRDRFAEIERRTDERVKAMMENARLSEQEKGRVLRLVHGGAP